MGDDDHGAIRQRLDALLDESGFAFEVVHAGGLIEDIDRRIAQQRAGEGDALALSARQAHAVIADAGGEAFGQGGDEVPRLRGPRGAIDGCPIGGVDPEGDVFENGAVEQQGPLRDKAELPPQILHVERGNVGPVDHDPPCVRIVEAQQQVDERRLANPVRAGQRDHLARGDGEGEARQHGRTLGIGKVHRLERDGSARARQASARRIARLGRHREQRLKLGQRPARHLPAAVDASQTPHRPGQQRGVEQESENLARSARAAGDRAVSREQDRDRRKCRHQRYHRPDHRCNPRFPQLEAPRRLDRAGIAGPVLFLDREGLDRGQHFQIAVRLAEDFGLGIAHRLPEQPQASAEQAHPDVEQRHQHRHHQRHRRVDQEQQHHRAARGHQHRGQLRQSRGEKGAEVLHFPADQRQKVALTVAFVIGDRERLDMGVGLVPQPGENSAGGFGRGHGDQNVDNGQPDQRGA